MNQKIFLNFFFSILLLPFLLTSCNSRKKSNIQASNFNLEQPNILLLNDALLEISGIVFYPKDSSVFAISDESGYLFKIHLKKKPIIRSWRFSKTRDFEGLALVDSTFYVLESNGNVFALNFSARGDTIYRRKYQFPFGKGNDFESIYFDPGKKELILICKKCRNDNKHTTSAYSLHPETGIYTPSIFTIKHDDIAKVIAKKEIKFQPSAATINPKTGDTWILSSVDKMIVVADDSGSIKKVFELNPAKFRQPEGITFTPWGDLIISNEAGDKYGVANLSIFKYKN